MTQPQDTKFSCTCGQLSGCIRNVAPQTVVRARCFCADCRAAEICHNQPDPGENGVDLVMVDPATLSIDQGADNLAAIKIYPKGILRWYAKCCGARLFNTLDTARFVFITVAADRVDKKDALGPEQARAFVKQPNGKVKHENAGRLYVPMILRSVGRLFTGRWRDNPLFDRETGAMRAEPHILTREERRSIGL